MIEIKTVIDDVGAIERQVDWYERMARRVAMAKGWRTRRIVTWLLVLSSEQNESSMTANREVFERAFPVPAASMQALFEEPGVGWPGDRAVALIDPARRRRV